MTDIPAPPPVMSRATPHDLPDLLTMQQKILNAMDGGQHYFIVPKTEAQFRHYLTSAPAEQIYQLHVSGQHAAQLVLRYDVEGFEEDRHTAALAHLKLGTTLPAYGLIQGALVDPDFRGQHLLQHLLQQIEPLKQPQAQFLLARIVPANTASWVSFLRTGYHIAAAAYDPDDERRVFYLYKSFADTAYFTETQLLPSQDFDAIRHMTLKGWRGTAYDRTADKIIFER